MADISLNIVDLGVLTIIGLSALMAFFRGFVREFISLASWVGASYVTLRTLPIVSKYLEPQVGSPVIATGIAAVAIFFITLILISIVTGLILKVLKPAAKVGLFDNLLGLCFGVARGTLMVAIAYYIMGIVIVEKDFPEAVKEAKSRPYIAQAATWVGTLTPTALNAITDKKSLNTDGLKASGAKVIKALDEGAAALPDEDTPDETMPSIEDLQQRLREENEKR
mgnify:CR=1 FL=1